MIPLTTWTVTKNVVLRGTNRLRWIGHDGPTLPYSSVQYVIIRVPWKSPLLRKFRSALR